ncbi:MAG: hypothetical protein K8H88_19185, partial [Sandaracinaceae bacterium]|nr:hypothetical protein [Sandaracinaceae bacterium]
AYPSFLTYTPLDGDPVQFVHDVSCVATAGVGGCGFEQPLEAVLKALSPSSPTAYTGPAFAPPTFFGGTLGHALDANAGFVRDESLLAVVLLTDEEDCSVSDPELFDPMSLRYAGDLNLRCFLHPTAVQPVQRYVDGLLALRRNRPDLLSFSVIAGVPTDLAAPRPTAEDFDRILADPRMQEQLDPVEPNRLRPSCDVPGRGLAFPPRRLVQVAQGLGPARSSIHSICDGDLRPAAEAIATLVGRRACSQFE